MHSILFSFVPVIYVSGKPQNEPFPNNQIKPQCCFSDRRILSASGSDCTDEMDHAWVLSSLTMTPINVPINLNSIKLKAKTQLTI